MQKHVGTTSVVCDKSESAVSIPHLQFSSTHLFSFFEPQLYSRRCIFGSNPGGYTPDFWGGRCFPANSLPITSSTSLLSAIYCSRRPFSLFRSSSVALPSRMDWYISAICSLTVCFAFKNLSIANWGALCV